MWPGWERGENCEVTHLGSRKAGDALFAHLTDALSCSPTGHDRRPTGLTLRASVRDDGLASDCLLVEWLTRRMIARDKKIRPCWPYVAASGSFDRYLARLFVVLALAVHPAYTGVREQKATMRLSCAFFQSQNAARLVRKG